MGLLHVRSWNLFSNSSDFRTTELTLESLDRISQHIHQDVSREETSSEARGEGAGECHDEHDAGSGCIFTVRLPVTVAYNYGEAKRP